MTRIPEPAPTGALSSDTLSELVQDPESQALLKLTSDANHRYLYWDKFKHREMPPGVDAADAWRFLKVIRRFNSRSTVVLDKQSLPFALWLTDEIQRLLHVLDVNACGPEDLSRIGIPELSRERYLVSALMEEAIASSQIEGAATTRQLAKDMLRENRRPRTTAEQMILNNYTAIRAVRDMRDDDLEPETLLWLQATLTKDTLAHPEDSGRLRSESDDIVVHDQHTNEVLFVPPQAAILPDELRRLCAYANSDDGPFEHPAVKASLLHFWLAYLHPFPDGNGRTARAVFYWYLIKHGYWLFEYLPVSRVIHGRRSAYERAYLYTETDDGDLTYFVLFCLSAIDQALGDLREYLSAQATEDAALQKRISRHRMLNHRQRALLGRALSDPHLVITIESHQTSHGVSYPTARQDLLELSDELGFLSKTKEGRAFTFRAVANLRDRMAGSDAPEVYTPL